MYILKNNIIFVRNIFKKTIMGFDSYFEPKDGYDQWNHPIINTVEDATSYVNWLKNSSNYSPQAILEEIFYYIKTKPQLDLIYTKYGISSNYDKINKKELNVSEYMEIAKIFFKAATDIPISCNKCGKTILYGHSRKHTKKEVANSNTELLYTGLTGGSRVYRTTKQYQTVDRFYCQDCYNKVIRGEKRQKIINIALTIIVCLVFITYILYNLLTGH